MHSFRSSECEKHSVKLARVALVTVPRSLTSRCWSWFTCWSNYLSWSSVLTAAMARSLVLLSNEMLKIINVDNRGWLTSRREEYGVILKVTVDRFIATVLKSICTDWPGSGIYSTIQPSIIQDLKLRNISRSQAWLLPHKTVRNLNRWTWGSSWLIHCCSMRISLFIKGKIGRSVLSIKYLAVLDDNALPTWMKLSPCWELFLLRLPRLDAVGIGSSRSRQVLRKYTRSRQLWFDSPIMEIKDEPKASPFG